MSVLDVFRPTVGRGGPGVCAARAGRGAGAGAIAPDPGAAAGRVADGAGPYRRHGAGHRRIGPAGLPRRLGQGHGRAADQPRGGDGEAARDRGRAAGDRHGGATAWRRRGAARASRSRRFTARSGRCGSTKGPATCRRSSSPAPRWTARAITKEDKVKTLDGGITRNGTGIEGIEWNILGQRYFPKSDLRHRASRSRRIRSRGSSCRSTSIPRRTNSSWCRRASWS